MTNPFPVISQSLRWRKWTFPAWAKVLLFVMPALVWLIRLDLSGSLPLWVASMPHTLPCGLQVQLNTGFLAFVCGVVLIALAILLVVYTRFDLHAEVSVLRDRLSMTLNGACHLELFWQDIVVQESRQLDVWMHTIGSGSASYQLIRCERRRNGRVEPVDIFKSFFPASRCGPRFVNIGQLREAFLLSLLTARPSLRIEDAVYALCEIDPCSLRHSASRK